MLANWAPEVWISLFALAGVLTNFILGYMQKHKEGRDAEWGRLVRLLDQLEGDIATLKGRAESLETELKASHSRENTLTASNFRLENENANTLRRVEHLEAENAELRAEVDRLGAEVHRLNARSGRKPR